MLLLGVANAQYPIIESEYIYSSKNLSVVIPDSIKEAIQIPSSIPVSLKMGDIRYINLFSKSRSHTSLFFEEAKGFEFLKETGSAYTENSLQQSKYLAFEHGSIQKHLFYYMPQIKSTGEKKKVNGYESCLYVYTNPSNITYNIWISDKLLFSVNPGFYFKGKGGITKVEYKINNTAWSLDLIRFTERKNVVLPPEQASVLTDTTRNLFPFFDAK